MPDRFQYREPDKEQDHHQVGQGERQPWPVRSAQCRQGHQRGHNQQSEDPAASALDPETEVEIEGALRVLLAGRTAIVIAHRLRSAERADRVIMIGDGRVIADGSHVELVETSPEYRRLVQVWERGLK